jgi:hypothetical protein
MRLFGVRTWVVLAVSPVVAALLAGPAAADTITIGGQITQATAQGTGPALNNPELNAILSGDAYTVTLDFTGAIGGPGTYNLAGASVTFADAAAAATETSFSGASFTVAPVGSMDQISMLGCLTTGSGCLLGNYLALNFMIPAAGLNLSGVSAQPIFGLTPLDLLEDDGTTDIQGSVTGYAYTGQGATPTPEPGTLTLLASGALLTGVRRFAGKQRKERKERRETT